MILDGFPNSDKLTDMKKNELDNIIAELEKYIAMLIALRCADIEIVVFCALFVGFGECVGTDLPDGPQITFFQA